MLCARASRRSCAAVASGVRYPAAAMRVLILGGDGYLGWPTALRFSARGHEVAVLDNFSRRRWHRRAGDRLADPDPLARRADRGLAGGLRQRDPAPTSATSRTATSSTGVVAELRPEAVVHYGEQPSAPYSMMSRQRAVETQHTNVIGTLNLLFSLRDHVPDCHLVKLGTMGEYGTPEHRHRGGVHRDRAQGPPRHPAVPEAAGLALSLLEGPRLDQHPLRLPDLGPARHRPQPGRRLRDRDRRDRPRRAPDHPLRLRRDVRHRAQPLLRAGGDRPPADRLRRGRADPRLPQHPRHAAVRRAGGENPAEAGRVPGLQPVHRAVLGRRAGRAGQASGRAPRLRGRDSTPRQPAGRAARSTTTTPTHTKLLDLGLEPTLPRRGAGGIDAPHHRAPPASG